MEWSVEEKPAYSVLKVVLSPGESVVAEPGAYMMHKGKIKVKTGMGGGFFKAIARSLLAGESVFLNTFIAEGKAEVWFAPRLPGDIAYIPLSNTEIVVQDSSYLAHHGDVDVSIAWRGLKGIFAEGQLVWLKLKGVGGAWVNSYGGIVEVDLPAGETTIVDNFHFVALSGAAKWKIRKFGGIKSFLLGGEGFVIEVEGPGRLWLQTRTLLGLAEALSRYKSK